jgi:hypothetical protein
MLSKWLLFYNIRYSKILITDEIEVKLKNKKSKNESQINEDERQIRLKKFYWRDWTQYYDSFKYKLFIVAIFRIKIQKLHKFIKYYV